MDTRITKWKHVERTILPILPRSKKIDTLKNDLIYTLIQSLIVFRNSHDATYDEVRETLEWMLEDMDIEKLMEHYVYLQIKKTPSRLNRRTTIGDLNEMRKKWAKQ